MSETEVVEAARRLNDAMAEANLAGWRRGPVLTSRQRELADEVEVARHDLADALERLATP